jgi:hypothetical protein
MNCNREFTSHGFKQHVEKGTTLCLYSHAESLNYSFKYGDEESSQKPSAPSPTVDLPDPFNLNHHLSEDDPNDDPFPQDNHSSGYLDDTNDDAGSYSSSILDSLDINDDGGPSDGEENELPMFETESVSSCADDYDIHIDPNASSLQPMPIHALLDWYKEHIATGFSQLFMSPEVKC